MLLLKEILIKERFMRTPAEIVRLALDSGLYMKKYKFMCQLLDHMRYFDKITNDEYDNATLAIDVALGEEITLSSCLYKRHIDSGYQSKIHFWEEFCKDPINN